MKILEALGVNAVEATWKANGWKQHDIFKKYLDGLDMFDEIEEERARYRVGNAGCWVDGDHCLKRLGRWSFF